jgi:hemerythrin
MITKSTDIGIGPASNQIVTWDNKLATGIELIDSQHMELVELTNKLYQACISGDDGAVFKEAMGRMVNYVRFHFGAEQQLLERIRYPDYADHKKQHDTLVKQILNTVKAAGEGKNFVANNFVRTLKEWIFGHIAFADRQYSLYVADQKRKGLLTDQMIAG